EAGADDCLSDETGHEITCAADGLGDVRDMLEARLGEPEHARIVWKPQNVIEVDDEVAGKIVRLLDTLDDHDDVQNVYANFEMSEAALKALTG
ncbi:MAG: YebC/PmpR family DNA-binding transcriptional regulator, partial [Pseudomonadota bacterium]